MNNDLIDKYTKIINEFTNANLDEGVRLSTSNFIGNLLIELYNDLYKNVKYLIEIGEISIVVNDVELKKTDRIEISRK